MVGIQQRRVLRKIKMITPNSGGSKLKELPLVIVLLN